MRQAGADGVPSRRILVLVVATVCSLAALVVGLNQWQDRARRLDAARREAMTLARVLEEQTSSTLRATDLALIGIAEGLRRDPELREHDPTFEDSLRRLLAHVPAVRALFVIGPDGFIIQDSDRDTPRQNLSDRDYFRAQVEDPQRGLFIGEPLVSRSVGTWFIGLSRRVETQEGGFAGVAAAAVDVSYFERLYEELGLGPGDVITLATRNASLIARQPRLDKHVGQKLVGGDGWSLLERALERAPSGSFQTVSMIDHTPRIFGYHTVDGQSLVVLVGLSRDRVLGPWRRGAAAAAAATAAAFALAVLLLWLAVRHARREGVVQARMAEAARLEALGRLTSGVAHDFNNLLQALSITLQLLAKRTRSDACSAELVEQGLSALERGRSLVSQLLGVARSQELELQEVDVNAQLTEMMPLLRNAAAPHANVELELAKDLEPARLDPSRLDAAILNLVVNARDAELPGRPRKGVVRISTKNCTEEVVSQDGRRLEAGRFVCLTVRDDGVGMTPEVRRRAMEPFFTTKGEHGTGLGLAQVYAFLREIGGDMQIESKPGAGTAVHLYIPRA
jgi:signal transduction histidine kinase